MKPRADRLVRVLVVVAIMALELGFVTLSFPTQKEKSFFDFSVFYCAGQIVRNGSGSKLYDLATQNECQSKIAAIHTFYPHAAFEALLFVPFTFFNYRTAYLLWALSGMGILMGVAYLIESRIPASLAISQYGRVRADLGLVYVVFLTFAPVTICLLIGQDALLMLLVFTLVFVLMKRGNDFVAGCILACGLYKFQVILPFAVILLLRRKWSLLRGFATVGTVLVIISMAVGGIHSLITYPEFLLFLVSHQRLLGFQPEFMPTLRGLLYVLSSGLFAPGWFWLLAGLSWVVTLWFAATSWKDEFFNLSFAVAVVAAVLSSYHAYNYELTLLLLPIAIICGELAQRGRLLSSHCLTLALGVLFFPPIHWFLVLRALYALMCLPVLAVFIITARLIRSDHFLADDAPLRV